MTSDGGRLLPGMDLVGFIDGTDIYRRFMDDYGVHDKGFFIVAPSGSGKTYFVSKQEKKHWIDGDDLWIATGAHPDRAWWKESMQTVYAIDQRSDVITAQARMLGLWIVGASNYWLVPDAIVLPHWDTHLRYIEERQTGHYDGGATSEDIQQVLDHRAWLTTLSVNESVPVFSSVEEAATHLANRLGNDYSS